MEAARRNLGVAQGVEDGSSPAPEERPGSPWRSLFREGAEEGSRARFLAGLDAVNAFGEELRSADEGQLRDRAVRLRLAASQGESLESLLPECFALVREAAHRELGERPYDVQILAGIALFHGKLLEMGTGEGKTLAAVAPVVLHAFAGRGVHVLTYNDYLARRDASWMEPVYRRLGVSVGFVEEGSTTAERQRAYGCDVTYLTVKEAGFDLLRDGLCLKGEDQVHRPFHLAVVDEADSLLIDEARIPLVIAGTVEEPAGDLPELAEVARWLRPELDFEVDEEGLNVCLTERGAQRAEAVLGCSNLFAAENAPLQAQLRNALHAQTLLRRDVDYIVRDGRVELVDELTGRVAENRHWPDGLQAALEAKEGLDPQPEGKVLGTITIQHLLRKYPRLCGMTATAGPAAGELEEVYGLEIFAVPLNRPCRRVDLPDRIYRDRQAQRRAVVEEVRRIHGKGRPILVGTTSVEESEDLARELEAGGLAPRVLNARNDLEEARIVAEAGAPGTITISTNMAGRGTDIRLGGSREAQRDEVVAAGGLHVLGTHRHGSRRIDRQLRGRAGRQGDPGSSRFLVSLEDELFEGCGIGRLLASKWSPVDPAEPALPGHPRIQGEIERAQRIAEGRHGDIRRRLLRHWALLEGQRCELQEWRQAVLEGRGDGLLAQRCAERWQDLRGRLGEERLRGIEKHLTLLLIDRHWSEYLAEMQAVRDEVHLVTLDGRDPTTEFLRTAGAAYAELRPRIEEGIAGTFEGLAVTADGVDWDAEGLRAPSSTWTYLVHDNVFAGNTFLNLANRASFGLWAVLAAGPLLFLWGLVLNWRRWRRRRRGRGAVPNGGPR